MREKSILRKKFAVDDAFHSFVNWIQSFLCTVGTSIKWHRNRIPEFFFKIKITII